MDLLLKHSLRAEADSPLAVLYLSSSAGVEVSLSESCSRNMQRAKCQGLGPMGPLAAHCAEDKLNRRLKKQIPLSNISASNIDELCTKAMQLHTELMHIVP